MPNQSQFSRFLHHMAPLYRFVHLRRVLQVSEGSAVAISHVSAAADNSATLAVTFVHVADDPLDANSTATFNKRRFNGNTPVARYCCTALHENT